MGNSLALMLIVLTGPGGQKVEVNPKQIVSIRNPRADLTTGIRCLIHTTDGKYIAVVELCDTVRAKLGGK
jgi:hypothetical protein